MHNTHTCMHSLDGLVVKHSLSVRVISNVTICGDV